MLVVQSEIRSSERFKVDKTRNEKKNIIAFSIICRLMIFSQIPEKLLIKRLKPVTEVNNIFSEFLLRNQYSTVDKYLELTSAFEKMYEENKSATHFS